MYRILSLLGLLIVSSLGSPGFAAAQTQTCGGQKGLPASVKPGVYRGTVAGLPALLSIGGNGEFTQYAYERKGLSIELTATQNGGKLILQESVYDSKAQQEKATACFNLTPSGTKLQGMWIKVGQKVGSPVILNRVDVMQLPLQLPATPGLLKLRRDDPYSFMLLNRPWVKTSAGRAVTEPLSGLSYLRLPGENAALNGALQDRQLKLSRYRLDCLGSPSFGSTDLANMEFEVTSQNVFLTPKMVSFEDGISSYCGGAHPNYYSEGVILDRLTGEKIALEDIWYSLDNTGQHKAYLANLGMKVDADSDCLDLLKTREFPFYTARLTKTGVQLTPADLPHVALACGESVTVPYAKLKSEADSSSPYYRDLYR